MSIWSHFVTVTLKHKVSDDMDMTDATKYLTCLDMLRMGVSVVNFSDIILKFVRASRIFNAYY